jgi:hypothetical protein
MNLKQLIRETLEGKDCCIATKPTNAPMLNENLGAKIIITENMKYHIDNKKPLTENTFRYGSKAFLDLWTEARYLYSRNAIDLSESDKQIILETHLGERGLFNGELVPLDLPMEDLEENTDDVMAVLNNPNIENDAKSMLFNAYKNGQLTSKQVIDIVKKTVKEHLNEEGKNTHNITLNFNDERLIKRFQTTPTFQKMLASNQMKNLKVGDNELVVNNVSLNGLERMQSMGLYKLNEDLNEAEDKQPPLNKPKRGGSKKFYVYVRNPKTKKIKKVSFGDTTGLSTKVNNPKARKAFAARHDCKNKKDRTKAGYWACNIGRYWKSLGGSNNFSGYW